jgi:PTS system mannose-specific IIA component
MEMRRAEIIDAVARVDEGDGVAVVTDMFGGTPSNLAMSILGKGKVEVVAGMNLPLLIKLASVRAAKPLDAAVLDAREAGRKYINVASQLLAGEPR